MNSETEKLTVIYDGECPFCSAYVRMQRLRALAEDVELVDARSAHPVLEEVRRAGLDLNEGMALKLNGELYHGADVIHQLALLTGPSGRMNRIWYWIFSSRSRARLLYPWMRGIRNLTLRVLGRRLIE